MAGRGTFEYSRGRAVEGPQAPQAEKAGDDPASVRLAVVVSAVGLPWRAGLLHPCGQRIRFDRAGGVGGGRTATLRAASIGLFIGNLDLLVGRDASTVALPPN
jgi:hypothetical protein